MLCAVKNFGSFVNALLILRSFTSSLFGQSTQRLDQTR